MSVPLVIACMKLVELRAGVDPLTGAVIADPASAGASPADGAALEVALRIAEACAAEAGTADAAEVVAISAGDSRCEKMLRSAVAAGATRAVRVVTRGDEPSALVAEVLARAVTAQLRTPRAGSPDGSRPAVVCCGDASVDRGSASVPAFLAAELSAAQALGLVAVSARSVPETLADLGAHDAPGAPDVPADLELLVERRLDRGRRERLLLAPPCVISVEAGAARLRRAPLSRVLASRTAEIEVLDGGLVASADPSGPVVAGVELVAEAPFRPRARVVPPPLGLSPRERILELTAALHERRSARMLVLGPEDAADELLATLAQWGELPDGVLDPSEASPDGTKPS